MERKSTAAEFSRLKLPRWKRETIVKFLIVLGMAGAGAAMIAAGLLAWVVGERSLLVAGTTSGSIFIAAGGLGFLKCLDGPWSK